MMKVCEEKNQHGGEYQPLLHLSNPAIETGMGERKDL
jgi:hypothetical protein